MKKFLFSILALLFIGSTAYGKGDNLIFVDDVIVPVGGGDAALLVNINLTEKNSSKGMMFTITLPAGIEFVKDGDAPVCYNGSMYGVDPTLNLKNANTLTLTVASTKTVKGSKGLLYAFKVKCTDSSFSGKGTISGIQASIDGNPVDIDGSEFNITTTDCDVVLDENSPFAPAKVNNKKLLVKRSLTENHWSTICLPFDLDWTTFKQIFGNDVVVAEFENYEYDGENLSVNFGTTDMTGNVEGSESFYANWPYLIKSPKTITSFEVTTSTDPGDVECDPFKKGKTVYGRFLGTYVADTYLSEENVFISNNSFYYSIGTTKIKGFRGYFWFKDQLSNTATCRAFVDGNAIDDATGIRSNRYTSETGKVYSISGRYMGENVDMKTLPKGVYIVDGVKIIND